MLFPSVPRLKFSVAWKLLLALVTLFTSAWFCQAQTTIPAPASLRWSSSPDANARLTTTDAPPAGDLAEPQIESMVDRSSDHAVVVQTLQSQDRKSAADLMEAIQILLPLRAISAAKSYLTQLQDLSLDDEALFTLHQQFGSASFLRLAVDKGLAPEGRTFSMRVLQAAQSVRRSPERLQSYVQELASSDVAVRRTAIIGLADAGEGAVPILLGAFRDPPQGVTVDQLRTALLQVGTRAEEPLIAALVGPDTELQIEAARALGRVGSRRALPHLIRPALVGDGELAVQAQQAIRRLGWEVPTSSEGIGMVRREVLRLVQGELPTRSRDQVISVVEGGDVVDPPQVELWTWDAATRNVISSRLRGSDAAALSAARMARDWFELEPTTDARRWLLTCRLENDQRFGGWNQPLPRGDGSAYALGLNAGVDEVEAVLQRSLEYQLHGAAVGAAEILGDLRESVTMNRDNFQSPLIQALHSSDRRVRFAAARAIMQIDPRGPYPGASYFLETLVELAQSAGEPRVLIGLARQDLSARLAGILSDVGFRVDQAADGKELLLAAFRNSDYDFMIVSDAIDCPPASEAIQQLRKEPKTKSTPVILLARAGWERRAEQLASWDAKILVIPEFADRAAWEQTIRDAQKLYADSHVGPMERSDQGAEAIRWLTHLLEYNQTYRWYDVNRVVPILEQQLVDQDASEDAIHLLGFVGTAPAQRALVDLASNSTYTIQQRMQAANAFTEAVLRHGLMLEEAEVLRQYDRYNASAKADLSTQQVLGQLLDVIETP